MYLRIWSRRSLHRFLRKSSNIRKAIRCVKFTKAVVRHSDIRDQNPSLGIICPGEPHQRSSNAPKFVIGLRRRQSGKSDVPVKQRGGWPKVCLKFKEQERATFFSPSEYRCLPASTLKTWGTRNCCGLRSVDAHDQQKRTWIFAEMDTLTKIAQSYDSHNRQWRSVYAWRGNSVCQRFRFIRHSTNRRGYARSPIAWKTLRISLIFLWVDQWSKTTPY